MSKTVIIIDMQKDFTTGSLQSIAAQAAAAVISTIVKVAHKLGYNIFYTMDTHDETYSETLEGKFLPIPHCIKGTPGWEVTSCSNLNTALQNVKAIQIQKDTFGSLQLHTKIDPNCEEIILVGVCTDICVISNALILRAYFPNMPITIYENACAGTSDETHAAALLVAKSCQIQVKTYEGGTL